MCGIAGWINYSERLKTSEHIIRDMTKKLTNRGPDNEGYYINNNVLFGHRRLIVVDPEGGIQPMIKNDIDRRFILIYNGELYNTAEVRHKLLKLGYIFKGHSDTEVLLMSFIEWGEKCLLELNGIFAFAIWEEKNKRLFLARDRMGVKPLFYYETNSNIIFASEIKSLLAHPLVEPMLDRDGVAEIMGLSPGRTPGHGIFCGIKELRPGYSMSVSKDSREIKQYWCLESHPHPDNLETTIEKVRWLVTDAIKSQLSADVTVSTFLSGGLDSSIISKIASMEFEKQNKVLNTWSVDYVDNSRYFKKSTLQPDSDAPWIVKMKQFLSSKHNDVILDSTDLYKSLESALYARDLPGMADLDSSLMLFCEKIKQKSTVALSGECADEIFGGYPWFYREDMLSSGTFPWSRNLELRHMIMSEQMKDKVNIKTYVNDRYLESIAETPIAYGESMEETRRKQIGYLNLMWFMQTLLDRKDRMSMANGLEVRVPFCDHRIVEYVWNIPWEMKYLYGREKGLLRSAFDGLLPDDVLWRKKSPYPKTHNPNYLQLVTAGVMDILKNKKAPVHEMIDAKLLINMINRNDKLLDEPWYGQLMTKAQMFAWIIQLNSWLKNYNVNISI